MAELRETATNGLRRGDHVRKGKGSTIYRVWGINPAGEVSVCKATTKTEPTRGCFYPAESFVRVEA